MDTEADLLTLKLIEVFAAALRDLNEGRPIPAKWREYLERELGPKKRRGPRPREQVTQRDLDIARRMLQHYLALEKGETNKKITTFVQELADEYCAKGRKFESKDVFEIYKKYQNNAMSDEIYRRLKANDERMESARLERGRQIQQRLETGETLEQMLFDRDLPFESFVAIRNHQTRGIDVAEPPTRPSATDYPSRRQAIIQWLNDGMNRGIHYDPVPIANLYAGARQNLIPKLTPRKKLIPKG